MSEMQEGDRQAQENLETGWQERQGRQENGAYDWALRMLWQNFQVSAKQAQNLAETKKRKH